MGHPLLDLTNKNAVVMGGTSGIGLAIARALAQAGANVIPSGSRAVEVGKVVLEIRALEGGHWRRPAMSWIVLLWKLSRGPRVPNSVASRSWSTALVVPSGHPPWTFRKGSGMR